MKLLNETIHREHVAARRELNRLLREWAMRQAPAPDLGGAQSEDELRCKIELAERRLALAEERLKKGC